MSYEKLGFVSGQKLKAEHLNYMEEGIANCASPSWNDIADKPFYSEMVEGVAEFDGDLTGKEYYEMDDDVFIVKISDNPLTPEELVNSTAIIMSDNPDVMAEIDAEGLSEWTVTEESIEMQQIDDSRYMLAAAHLERPFIYVIAGDLSDLSESIPPEGTYFVYYNQDEYSLYNCSLSCLSGMQEKVHKIDAKYLPEVGLKADKVKAMIDEAMEATISEEAVSEMINNAIGVAIGGSY